MAKHRKFFVGLSTLGILTLAACGNGGSGDTAESTADSGSSEGTLEVWSFTDEISTMVNDYYLPQNPDLDYDINIVTIPTDEFETKLDPVLGTDGAPDVILLEQNFAKKYVESGMMADLSQFDSLNENSEVTYDYVKDLGTNEEGTFVANAWQAAPGAFFYRDSIAKEFLGLETPEDVQNAISDWDGFIETARNLKEASNGEVYMISSTDDIRFSYMGAREQGWVVDGKLVIDEKIYEMMETALLMNEEGLMLDAPPSSEAYFGGMSSDEIFGYSLPTWGLHFWLKPNGGDATAGDWRMVQGPATYFRGGTWIGMTETSHMKEAAADLIEFVTVDDEFLTEWANDTGDVVSNESVVSAIKEGYSDEYLGGQNHYAAFADMIDDIDSTIITEYDQTLNNLFLDHALTPYSKGEVDLDAAIQSFKDAAQNAFPNLVIE